jgi:cyclopropane-fatty-acyl-phospholipid synthase
MKADDSSQADALHALLADIQAKAAPRIAFRLWDGRTIPGDAADAPTIAFNDPGAVTRLIRRPKLDTFLRLHLSGRIDLSNGTLFDFAERRPEGKPGRFLKSLDRGRIVAALRAFAFAPGGPALPEPGRAEGAGSRAGTEDANRANVQHHYDVSNDFYRLFLDERMVYTCAYFDGWHDDLDRAQADKLEMICRKLRLAPGERMLDIGSGWGALLIHAATHHGVTGLGVTLSEEQAKLSRARIAEAGLADRIEIRLADYQSLDDSFDKIASIGMFEHVGLRNHESYFRAVHRLLRPRGLYLHHAITRRARRTMREFRAKRPEAEAIVRYIFPGGELDHIGLSAQNLEAHGFEVHDVENWRLHYARTTRMWAERLRARRDEAVGIAGEELTRAWELYLAGVSLSFSRGGLTIFQTLASKRDKGAEAAPPSRRDLYR